MVDWQSNRKPEAGEQACFFSLKKSEKRSEKMPRNKLEDIIFTIIMAGLMVYCMVLYNVGWNMGGLTNASFGMALHEMPIMWPIAFLLELLFVGKIAAKLAFTVVSPDDRPQIITYAVSFSICGIMCPLMSLIATFLFSSQKDLAGFVMLFGRNLPAALLLQFCYVGPLVRLIFRNIFRNNIDPVEGAEDLSSEGVVSQEEREE